MWTSQNLTLKGLGKPCCQEMGINKAQIVTGLQGSGNHTKKESEKALEVVWAGY